MTTNDIENFGDEVIKVIKSWFKSSGFKDRKLTDSPTDDLQVVNKKYVDDADDSILPAPGTSGNVLTSNGTAWISSASPTFNPATTVTLYDDFVGGQAATTLQLGMLQWAQGNTNGGAGAAISESVITGHLGVISNGVSGNSGVGKYQCLGGFTTGFGAMNQGGWTMKWNVSLNATTGQRHRFGLTQNPQDHINGGTDGIFFELDTSANANWRGCVRSGSSSIYTSTTVAPTLNFMTLTMVMNTLGTSIEFFIDGVSLGALASGIPTVNGCIFAHETSINNTDNTYNLDYFYYTQALAR